MPFDYNMWVFAKLKKSIKDTFIDWASWKPWDKYFCLMHQQVIGEIDVRKVQKLDHFVYWRGWAQKIILKWWPALILLLMHSRARGKAWKKADCPSWILIIKF